MVDSGNSGVFIFFVFLGGFWFVNSYGVLDKYFGNYLLLFTFVRSYPVMS